MNRENTKYIVIHCAATRASMDVGAKEIDQWHRERGWSGIGYHYVIRRSGKVEKGRPEKAVGAHVEGHNYNTLGICLVGGLGEGKGWPPEDNFTPAQRNALYTLLSQMLVKYPGATILGHRDFPGVAKACPSFDARSWAKAHGLPAAPALRGYAKSATVTGSGVGLMSAGSFEAADQIERNADWMASLLDTGRESFSTVAQYVAIGGRVLALIALLSFLYALYRAARMGWRWWRGEDDFGRKDDVTEPGFAAGDVMPPPRKGRRP